MTPEISLFIILPDKTGPSDIIFKTEKEKCIMSKEGKHYMNRY